MVDDLRDDAGYMEEEDQPDYKYQETMAVAGTQPQFLGMTPQQRLVIAVLILMMVCILGSFFLLITGSIALPM
jgi:hypothetical protein